MSKLSDRGEKSVSERLDKVSVVLVAPRFPGNLGSVARAMKNMGLSRLVLVDPQTTFTDEAWRLAGKAPEVLEEARIVSGFDQAVSEMTLLVAATSARDRSLQQPVISPRQAAVQVRKHSHSGEVGLVFGCERSGLPDDLLARCQLVVSIPAAQDYPVLNLSQAVLICCYEIFQTEETGDTVLGDAVSQREREELYGQIRTVLTEIGFLSSSNPQHVMRAIRAFWGGPEMRPRDLRILRGIMSHIQWYVREGYKLGPDAVRKP